MSNELIKVITTNDGINVIESREVARMTGKRHDNLLRDIGNLIKRNPEYSNFFIESSYKNNNNQSYKCYLLTKQGCEIIENKYKLQTHAGRLEIKFLDGLEEALSPFRIKGIRQFPIDINDKHYRIDYYIQNLNIAIEYDENGHKNYSYEEHELRQEEIERELGCKFIRVTDNNSDLYNIGLVIKEIFKTKAVA